MDRERRELAREEKSDEIATTMLRTLPGGAAG
jgi:hypothetical protein